MSIRKQAMRFWKIFLEEKRNLETALLNHNEQEIQEIKKILGTYFEELCNCELEVEEEDGVFELLLFPEQEKNAQIICSLLKQIAPPEVKQNWVIHACLPPLSKKALSTIVRIKEQDYGSDQFVVYYEIDDEGHFVDVKLYCDAFAHLDPNKATEIGLYMLQLNIGEIALEGYINVINVVDEKPTQEKACSLSSFFEVLLDIIEEKEWTMYEDVTSIYRAYHLSEEKIEETLRKDMKMIVTMHPLLMNEYLNDEYFIYHQFFDLGGEYGYLYYENEVKSAGDAYVRQTLEKNIHELLYPLGIARTIGGAIGTKYAYIDLAIFDKEAFLKALPKINNKLDVKLAYKSYEE